MDGWMGGWWRANGNGWVQLSMIRPALALLRARLYMCVRMRWWTDALFLLFMRTMLPSIRAGRVRVLLLYLYLYACMNGLCAQRFRMFVYRFSSGPVLDWIALSLSLAVACGRRAGARRATFWGRGRD